MTKKTYTYEYKSPFTEEEFKIIRYSMTRVAHHYSCDKAYVSLVARGKRNPDTQLAKLIIKALTQILHVNLPIHKKCS